MKKALHIICIFKFNTAALTDLSGNGDGPSVAIIAGAVAAAILLIIILLLICCAICLFQRSRKSSFPVDDHVYVNEGEFE